MTSLLYEDQETPRLELLDHSPHLNVKDFLHPKFSCNGEALPKQIPEHPHLIFDKTWLDERIERGASTFLIDAMDQTRAIGRVIWSAEFPLKQVILRGEKAEKGGSAQFEQFCGNHNKTQDTRFGLRIFLKTPEGKTDPVPAATAHFRIPSMFEESEIWRAPRKTQDELDDEEAQKELEEDQAEGRAAAAAQPAPVMQNGGNSPDAEMASLQAMAKLRHQHAMENMPQQPEPPPPGTEGAEEEKSTQQMQQERIDANAPDSLTGRTPQQEAQYEYEQEHQKPKSEKPPDPFPSAYMAGAAVAGGLLAVGTFL